MSTDKKGTQLLARTFFNQLRANGYSSHQVIGVATELLGIVTENLRDADKATVPVPEDGVNVAPQSLAL